MQHAGLPRVVPLPPPPETGHAAAVSGGVFTTSSAIHGIAHAHLYAQLLLPMRSPLVLDVAGHMQVVAPSAAMWIPPGMPHRLHHGGGERVACLRVDPAVSDLVGDHCRVLIVPALLRHLILQCALRTSARSGGDGVAAERLALVLLDELVACEEAALPLPMPTDRRLQRLAHSYIADPTTRRSLPQWGRQFGMSDRNLARLFRRETGMSFGEWTRALQVMTSLQQLMSGRKVAEVADFFGYSHPSTFIAMFKKAFGESPARFVQLHGVVDEGAACLQMHGRA